MKSRAKENEGKDICDHYHVSWFLASETIILQAMCRKLQLLSRFLLIHKIPWDRLSKSVVGDCGDRTSCCSTRLCGRMCVFDGMAFILDKGLLSWEILYGVLYWLYSAVRCIIHQACIRTGVQHICFEAESPEQKRMREPWGWMSGSNDEWRMTNNEWRTRNEEWGNEGTRARETGIFDRRKTHLGWYMVGCWVYYRLLDSY